MSRPAYISPYLVFPFQHQQISDLPKGQSQSNNLSLIYVVGQLAYMDHTWRNTRTADVTFEFFAVVAIGCKKKTEADTIREGTEGSGSSWIMDWLSWQRKQHRHDKHFNKKDSLLHGNPPTWVHDIGPVGYAGRKEFVGSPLQTERKQWFTSVHSPMRAQHGRWRARLSYYRAIVW